VWYVQDYDYGFIKTGVTKHHHPDSKYHSFGALLKIISPSQLDPPPNISIFHVQIYNKCELKYF